MADNIHKGHRQRVRQKFIKSRFTGFADHEKLELLLFYSRPVVDTNEIAHNLLNKFGTIAKVFDASVEQLMDVEGINESSAVLIKLIPEMIKEYSISEKTGIPMKDFKEVCDFFKLQFAGEKNEKVKIAFLDDKLRLISCEDVMEGAPNKVMFNTRKLIELTYKTNCTNVILAHNHPNGDALPSDEDLRTTEHVYKLLKTIEVDLLDHVIVAGGNAVSLRENGAFALL